MSSQMTEKRITVDLNADPESVTEDQAKAAFLAMIAEGKLFAFLTAEAEGEEDKPETQVIMVNTLTDARNEHDLVALEYMFQTALEQVRHKLGK